MNAPKIESMRARSRYLKVAGIVAAAVGGILAKIGTTSIGLFVFYLLLFFAGLGLMVYSQSVVPQDAGLRSVRTWAS